MSIINTAAHVFAAAIADAKKAAATIQHSVLPALQALHADAPAIEAISGLIDPRLANAERVADAILGQVIAVI